MVTFCIDMKLTCVTGIAVATREDTKRLSTEVSNTFIVRSSSSALSDTPYQTDLWLRTRPSARSVSAARDQSVRSPGMLGCLLARMGAVALGVTCWRGYF